MVRSKIEKNCEIIYKGLKQKKPLKKFAKIDNSI